MIANFQPPLMTAEEYLKWELTSYSPEEVAINELVFILLGGNMPKAKRLDGICSIIVL